MVELGHKWKKRRQRGREGGREGGQGGRGLTGVPRGLVDHAHVAAFIGGLELPGAVQELAFEPEGLSQGVGGVGKKEQEEDEDEGEGEEGRKEARHGWCVDEEDAILASSSSSSWSSSGRRTG